MRKLYQILTGRTTTLIVYGVSLGYGLIVHSYLLVAVMAVILYIGSILDSLIMLFKNKLLSSYSAAIPILMKYLTPEQKAIWTTELAKGFLPLKLKVKSPIIDV